MMQATTLMETASGKGCHSNRGNLQRDLSSNSKKSSSGCNEVKPIYPDDEWDSLALEQGANDREISNNNTSSLVSSFSEDHDPSIQSAHCQSSELEDSIGCAFLNKTYCIYYSESQLKNENTTNLSSELDPEMEKSEEVFFDILEPQDNRTIALERIFKISDADPEETAEEMQKYDIDEDSQQEYHSAEEQEYISNSLPFVQAKTLSTSNLEVAELRNSGCEVKCASNLEDNHIKLETSSVISSDSLNVFAQEYAPCISKFQNCDLLKDYYEPKHEKCKEQETSSVYPIVFDDIVQKSNSLENESQSKNDFLNPQKTEIYTEKMKSEIFESKDFCGNVIVKNRISQHLQNSSTLPQDKTLETLQQSCKNCQTSWSSIFDDSVISACGCSHYKSLQSTPNPASSFSAAPPKIAVRNDQVLKEDCSLKAVDGKNVNKTYSEGEKRTCPTSVRDAAGCTITVHQTVDVSTDFRACFTTTRATNARPSVVSTSSNTEVTMMSRKRPSKWQSEKQSVACNTDWSYGQDGVDIPVGVTKGAGKSLSVDSKKPDGNFQNKDSPEFKTCDNTDLQKHPERELQFSEEMVKDLPSKCCKKIMQRAIEAEMHLLNVHYQMCHRHCCDIYKLVMESKGLNRNLPSNSAKKELGSALLSVLGDLKVRYMNLKEKIHKGIPLEELPPLSVESKLLTTFSTFVSRLMKEESHAFSGADSEVGNQTASDGDVSSSLKKAHSQVSLLSGSSHPKQDTSHKTDVLKNGGINVDFSQLKLDDKECRNDHEISEDWFDAKENMTGVDSSGTEENQINHDRRNLKFTVEMKNYKEIQRDKGFLIHVGGLCPSVSEADLRSYFHKYHISEISICDSSTNYRYASLAFKKNHDAKMAVEEMNGIEINGKSVNVRLVKSHGECTSPFSSKKILNNLEKSTNKEISAAPSVSTLSRTRPRQMVSEQDSELSPLEQDAKKNCKQIESAQLVPKTPVQFIPANTLNLSSFTKIIKRLAELHPEVSRDDIIDALQEVRMNRKGFLNGLSISTIVEMTSSVLKNSTPHQE
ncbi:PREDICTED: RNA-binding protein 44 isoform X1 [Chinchilla lanigera]|uniref:RNA-binding protein 44 n=2 Tax=Chinchilla lanigera TaxID=34839 RepID=A0A8C2YJA7_CHILA|nr:PREDICTED: RNA-binding protein 44 isoform X1 [Chinchilla lanigera]XP_005411262.1 PREDICTED: RNA-binding protein 44 isoform X1 [Chinchilla lanigera]